MSHFHILPVTKTVVGCSDFPCRKPYCYFETYTDACIARDSQQQEKRPSCQVETPSFLRQEEDWLDIKFKLFHPEAMSKFDRGVLQGMGIRP